MPIKTSKGKHITYSLIRVFVLLCFLCFLCMQNRFVKQIKTFEIALMTSFTLLLNSSYYSHDFFSIITIFFNYHIFFQLLQSFLSQSFLS